MTPQTTVPRIIKRYGLAFTADYRYVSCKSLGNAPTPPTVPLEVMENLARSAGAPVGYRAARSARMVGTSAKLLAAAAAAHLLAVLRLLCIDLAQPPFTAILLPSELHHVSRSLLLVHRRALPQLNATLFSLAALPGAKELRITLWQPLHTSEDAAGEATARLLRSIGHLGLAISHLRPATCTPQTCRRLAAGSAAAMGGLRTAAAIMADKLVDGLDVAFAGEAASVVVMESGVELAPDALQFLDFAASLMHSARALPLPGRVVLGTTACRLRAAHRDWRGRAASLSP